jgi:serine O-acetyltransferase
MSIFRDTLEEDLYRGRRVSAFPLRVVALLLFGRGQRGCIAWLRFAQFCDRNRVRLASRWASAAIERRYGCYIHLGARIGPGLKLPHPVGIVIGEGVVIGARCTIYQHVTLGGRRLGDWRDGKYPTLGEDVVLFCGAVVLGALEIGDRVTVGANSVVLDSAPADSVAVGAPARVCEKDAALSLARRA